MDYVSSSDEENPYYSRGGKDSDDEDAVKELSNDDIIDMLVKEHRTILEREVKTVELQLEFNIGWEKKKA